MTKSINKTITIANKIQKTLVILIIFLLSPIIIVIIYILWNLISDPIFNKFDKDKFTTLNTQMKSLHQTIIKVSDGDDDWKYAAVCSAIKSGWMETGSYNCVTSISTQKTITSVQELNDLQAKYYPVIDNSDILRQKTSLDRELPNDFGNKFVVSSAEKKYTEVKTGIVCRYLIELNQFYTNSTVYNEGYGNTIDGNKSDFVISLRCEETARNPWYEKVSATSMLIPEFE
jgi:hypothetical protein